MKKNILFLTIIVTILIGCSEENGISTAKDNVIGSEKSKAIPEDIVYDMLKKPSAYSFDQINQFYRDNLMGIKESNLKNIAIILLMDKGLADKGKPEDKIFYLNQFNGFDSGLVNIENFYKLLNSTIDLKVSMDLLDIEEAFYEKNIKAIETLEWPSEELKKKKVDELTKQHEFFSN